MDLGPALIGAVFGGVVGVVVYVLCLAVEPRRICRTCESKLPRFPKGWRQWLLSRRTCAVCGCEVNH